MTEIMKVHFDKNNIATITIDDIPNKNCMSPEFFGGLRKVSEEIRSNTETKVVVFHGLGSYFCSGGNKQLLLDISEEKKKYTDIGFFHYLLDCDVPTIAAMQGHAIGGGLIFGMYADAIVMAEECIYSANFMHYGFTPGVGATIVIPEKCGKILGNEMLLSGKDYLGRELKERGISAHVVKKADVLQTAMSLAKNLAEKPLISLKILKHHLNIKLRNELPSIIAAELEMHRLTFTRPEVKARIEKLFEG